jgi:uncharacterized protein YigE (DUF2233 family)
MLACGSNSVLLRRVMIATLFALVGSPTLAAAVEITSAQIAGKPLTVCRVDLSREHLQLFLRDGAGRPIKRLDRLAALVRSRGQKLTFAMNAGMYHGDFAPVGLFVSEAVQFTPLNTARGEGNFFLKPNGVFVVTPRGGQVVESSDYPAIRERVLLATQSGPMLVHRGKIHPAFKPDSESRLYRNGVGCPTPGVAAFVNSEAPVNFYEFASFFRDVLHCSEALFLDGTVSSLYSAQLERSDFRMDLGPIIGVVEMSPAETQGR